MNKSVIALIGILTFGAVACDSGTRSQSPISPTSPGSPTSPNPPTPSPEPTPAPFTQVLTGVVGAGDGFGEEEDDWVKSIEFVAARDGMATLTLDWSDGAIDLDLSLTALNCIYVYGSECQRYEHTDDSTKKPERISRAVNAGETYRIWLTNWAEVNAPQNYRLEIEIR
jgi:hypothetical protein